MATKNFRYEIHTDVTAEPVTTAEVKAFSKIAHSQDDSIISIMISAVREMFERYTGLSFAEKTIYYYYDECDEKLNLPFGPLIVVNEIVQIAEDDLEETAFTDYVVNGSQILFNAVPQFPICIRAVVGYDTPGSGYATATALSSAVKLAILKEIDTQFYYRSNLQERTDMSNSETSGNKPDKVGELSNSSKNILRSFIKPWAV